MIVDFLEVRMQNFDVKYPQSIERASCRCVILLGSIFTLSKMWDVDAKFAKGVSLNPRKGKMQIQLYMTGRLKSICKFEEKQVADTLIPKRASVTANIKGLQIHQLPKEHLHKQINRGYRYIRFQKSKSPHRSTYFNHDTPKSKKKTMQSGELESGLPDEAEQESIVFFLALRLS